MKIRLIKFLGKVRTYFRQHRLFLLADVIRWVLSHIFQAEINDRGKLGTMISTEEGWFGV